MPLTQIVQPTAVVIRRSSPYDQIIDQWNLPTVAIPHLNLNRQGQGIGVAQAAAHPAFAGTAVPPLFVRGFQWNDNDNNGDWFPQGLSGTGDAFDNGVLDDRRWLVASWHNDGDTRTRVSFVDLGGDSYRYRHALLVEPIFGVLGATFRDVQNHAGGVAWYRDRLFIVDTRGGLRVFATDQIKQVATGDHDRVGRQPNGEYHAHDYRYIVPQVARYSPLPGFYYRFSFCGVDRSVAPHAIVTGEYESSRTQLYWWPIDNNAALVPAGGSGAVVAVLGADATDTHLQGVHATRARGPVATAWLSSTRGTNESLLRRGVNDAQIDQRLDWPDKPEGLTYFPQSDELWNASERRGRRVVFAVRRQTV
jgi:hypothetical protein